MSEMRKFVITTVAMLGWLIYVIMAMIFKLPFGTIFLLTLIFGGIIGAVRAP